MEVPGKQDEEASRADDTTLICLSCDIDGLKEPAYGFCQDCQEHLCETCYKHHRRARPFKNHELIVKDLMPNNRVIADSTLDDTADYCINHQDKPLEFYCRDHKLVACYVCVTLEHKQCKVDYILDVSGSLSDEINDLLKQMESLITKCQSNIENISKVAQSLDQRYAKFVKDIKALRKKINESLDRMETEIMNKAESFVKNAKIKQKNIKSACLDVTEELEYSHSLVSKLREDAKHNKLFIAMKNVAKRLPLLEDKEKHVLDENTIDDCIKLTRNTDLINQFESENVYGILFTGVQPTPDRKINIQYTDTINMKTKSEEKQCNIMGMVMISPTRMIVADNTNFKIKLIDSERRVVVTEIKMSSQPVDVIILPENKLAVTLEREKCIQILSYTDVELSSDRRIDVKELCNGIAYCQYKFVVTCWSSKKIIIINLEGCILKVLRSPAMFNGPSRVLISKDEKFLYVTDRDLRSNSSVMKIDLEGNLISVFKESGYAVPYGLQQLEDETILVCFQDRGTVLRLTSNLKRCDIIGPEKENIHRPKAITYCNIYHKLYVSCSSNEGKQNADIVKVFNVKWI